MKKSTVIVIGSVIILLAIAIVLFWPHGPKTAIGSIKLSGAAGTEFAGYYIRDGQRVPVSGVLPWSLQSHVTEFELRKKDATKTITVTVSYGRVGSRPAFNETVIGEGDLGVRERVQRDGLATETFTQ
jgi:hypothetical protein